MSGQNFVVALVLRLREAGVVLSLDGNKLRVRPWRSLASEDRKAVRANQTEIIAYLRAEPLRVETLPAKLPVEETPEVYVGRQRVTERDVVEALTALGDEVVADYRAGRMTKREAYAIARNRLKQLRELSCRR